MHFSHKNITVKIDKAMQKVLCEGPIMQVLLLTQRIFPNFGLMVTLLVPNLNITGSIPATAPWYEVSFRIVPCLRCDHGIAPYAENWYRDVPLR